MEKLTFDYSKATPFYREHELKQLAPYIELAHKQLHDKTGAGSDFTDWVDLPETYDKAEFAAIKKASEKRF